MDVQVDINYRTSHILMIPFHAMPINVIEDFPFICRLPFSFAYSSTRLKGIKTPLQLRTFNFESSKNNSVQLYTTI